ncbi:MULTISPECIES: enoyl-CoA hydratase/isomerase family protein [Burkholderiaceae]|uniref:enoyl-CoA hydratase-related protein n=1 Tax=Burkholderiaceae TaxID=119060 RepID=UPI00142027AC|nr:enoyl-CoA hydratase/isomerase family protein [Burkholderia sp. Ax-1724]NIF80861.1 enoyl-CoA hydratase/isomerase family protein [Paraburkholderia sp. Cy-641]
MNETLSQLVTYEARDGRAYITFNRPEKKNALTEQMLDMLMDHLDRAEADDDVRVIVFRGAGGDFCTGHDLAEVGHEYGEPQLDATGKPRRPSQRARLHHDRHYIARFQRIFLSPKPTLALISGYCIGAGLYIAEGCDLSIASDNAKIGHPEQKLGLSGASYFGAWEIMAMGPRKARELLLLAELWSAQDALAAGLVNRVVPQAELTEAGEAWAERIVRLPRDGLAIGKAAAHLAYDSLRLTSQFSYGYVMHALATNVRYEKDEFNFMKAKRESGVRASSHGREAFYKSSDGADTPS